MARGTATTTGRHGRAWAVALLAAALALSTAAAALAAGAGSGAGYATVELSGVVILRVRDAGGWPSVYARADEIYKRLNEAINAYQERLSPELVRVEQVGATPAVFVGEHLIVTVDEASARLNGTRPSTLAAVWADNLRGALRRFVSLRQGPATSDL